MIRKTKLPFGILESRKLIQKLGFWWNPVEFIQEVNKFVEIYNNKPKRVLNWKTPRERYI